MKIITSIRAMKSAAERLKSAGRSIGFVPTMGYLHRGHLSLVRASKRANDATVVSVFVNPTQFGPREDLESYPRDLRRDARLLRAEGVDILFHPRAEKMYPPGYGTYVEVPSLSKRMCGLSRPTHFRGVCTVVLKLFHIVKPDRAYFGQKDAQQAVIIRRMARDLDCDVRVVVRPIVREPDGLALSSRNVYLSPPERRAALVLTRTLNEAKMRIERGERRASAVLSLIRRRISEEPLARLDYAVIADPESLDPVGLIKGRVLIALAVFIGRTRLIDNLTVEPRTSKAS